MAKLIKRETWNQFCVVVKIVLGNKNLDKSALFKIFYAVTKVFVQEYHWKFIFSISTSDFFPSNNGNDFIKELNR